MQPTVDEAVDVLTRPLALPCGAVLPGRIAKSAMSEQLGDRVNAPTAELTRLYARWGTGGGGLLITGNVMVDRGHLGEPKNVVVDDDRHLEQLRAWAQAAQAGGTPTWVQLNHPGRQALRIAGTHPVAPSPIRPKVPGAPTPKELTGDEIRAVVGRFAVAAGVVQEAGFHGVQIHGAHGYLVSQFLSPRANVRTDEWGGDAERRMRFVLEVLRAIRARVGGDYPVGIKLNSADFQRGGFSEEESMAVVAALAAEGLDLLEVSGGTYESPAMATGDTRAESTKQREAYFLDYAEKVRGVTSVPLMVTGGFRTPGAMREAITSGATDLVGLARPFALDAAVPTTVTGGGAAPVMTSRRLSSKQLDAALELYFHTRQIQRIGGGHEPQGSEPLPVTATRMLLDNGWAALRRKRGG
ncbi:NADH:flavin oxidoreductase/NADH oxidase family protein [Paraconexibacter antarcticus]|uniref:NADH:flavin oxidoreductase/NADH oxidase family protein n=1 Tax=Paraconexibacter antarcticus TaxID=2949664 RepID=A0ABY5DP93_9ACTN|nr:NADH:flavin oxidoreductase/NADH oxidase family protein [Paraconexibacter antarcticus]UTI63439.1 NADH:flavin oxidoreductase/NADH oxidase family protein [Paraconexibacter antarcticus]